MPALLHISGMIASLLGQRGSLIGCTSYMQLPIWPSSWYRALWATMAGSYLTAFEQGVNGLSDSFLHISFCSVIGVLESLSVCNAYRLRCYVGMLFIRDTRDIETHYAKVKLSFCLYNNLLCRKISLIWLKKWWVARASCAQLIFILPKMLKLKKVETKSVELLVGKCELPQLKNYWVIKWEFIN